MIHLTTEEKLQYFMDSAMEDCYKQQKEILDDYQTALNQIFEEHKAAALQKADMELKYESERIRMEANKTFAKEHLHIRRKLMQKTNELTEQIFEEVNTLLAAYKKTNDYTLLLEKQISDAIAFAGNAEMIVYLDPEDADKKPLLEQATLAVLTISNTAFGGGTRALIPSRNILIDHSFESKINDARASFHFSGCTIYAGK